MPINTSKTIQRTSTVLGKKCEETTRNMEKLMRESGCAGAKMERVTLPAIPGMKDDVVFVGLNGVGFYFLRGKSVQMPAPVAQILRSCGMTN